MTSLAIDFPPSESSRLFHSVQSQIVLLYGNGFDFYSHTRICFGQVSRISLRLMTVF